ncbi:MAG: hypothetical protein AAF170_14055 [Bacteroidota bacterium]
MISSPAEINDVIEIASGYNHSLAVQADGTVIGCGDYGAGQTAAPEDLSDAVSVAGGLYHSVALRRNGTVVAWGRNDQGQTEVPMDLRDIVEIAAGPYRNLALRAAGTVAGWGYLGVPQVTDTLTSVAAIALGEFHTLVLKTDGAVLAWDLWNPPILMPDMQDVVAVEAAGRRSLALHADGTVSAWWGMDPSGIETIPTPASSGFVSISGGGNTRAGILGSGFVGCDRTAPLRIASASVTVANTSPDWAVQLADCTFAAFDARGDSLADTAPFTVRPLAAGARRAATLIPPDGAQALILMEGTLDSGADAREALALAVAAVILDTHGAVHVYQGQRAECGNGEGLRPCDEIGEQMQQALSDVVRNSPDDPTEPPDDSTEAASDSTTTLRVFPNPTFGVTRAQLDLPELSQVRLVIRDSRGREVGVVFDGTLEEGPHRIEIDLSGFEPGVYLIEEQHFGHIRHVVLVQ